MTEHSADSGLEATINLTDPTLFGNDAAEDERDDVFYSYAVERSEVDQFADPQRPIAVARAFKGEGKSALLRLTRNKIRTTNPAPVHLARTASELAPEVTKDEYHVWVRGWKASILSLFAVEIGARIGIAWSDDAMSLVEEAEKTGFRKRSFVSSLVDRLNLPPVDVSGTKVALPTRKVLGTPNSGEVLKRYAKGKFQLWLFVDDIDKNFENSRAHRMRTASFFDACRELTNVIPELIIRSVIRPNVWTALRLEFESLSHVEQYIVDLTWSEDDIAALLATRVEGYLKRTGQLPTASKLLKGDAEYRRRQMVATVFESPILWGRGNSTRPPHVALYTLSKHRPRWVVELAKVAAAAAVRRNHHRISRDDIFEQLEKFGKRRIEDTVAEFKSQCPDIQELVAAFAQEREQMTTAELLKLIENKILSHLSPTIGGVSGKVTSRQVAALLFEIGLYYARRQRQDGDYEHFDFSDKPSLLRARTNIDEGVTWEIHPVFRQALEIRTPEGREIRKRSVPTLRPLR